MQDGARQARGAPRVAVPAAIALAVRKQGDERLGFSLAAPPQIFDLIRSKRIADNNETVAVENTDRRINFLGSQDLEPRHAIVGLQVASQRFKIHGHAQPGEASRNSNGICSRSRHALGEWSAPSNRRVIQSSPAR